MSNILNEELGRMKSLFSYQKGRVISEQTFAGTLDPKLASTSPSTTQDTSDLDSDIQTITKELNATFNCDEQKIVNILKKYTPVQKLKDFLDKYKAATGKDLGISFGNTFTPYSDKVEWADLSNHLKSLGVTLSAQTSNGNTITLFQFPQNLKKDDTKKTNTQPPIPKELVNVQGVQAFQDWLDQHKPGWATGLPDGLLNKKGGYGRFGPRTTAAWKLYQKEYLLSKNNPNTNVNPVTQQEIEKIKVDIKKSAQQSATTSDQDINQQFSSQPPQQ